MTDKPKDSYLSEYDNGYGDQWISSSMLALMMMCPVAAYRKYILRDPEPRGVRAVTGTSAHKAREKTLTSKLNEGKSLDLDTCKDIGRDSVNEAFQQAEIMLDNEYEGKSKEDARGLAVDTAVSFVAADNETFIPAIDPVAVEFKLAVAHPDSKRVIVGKLDCLDVHVDVCDLKTTNLRPKNQDFADTDMGLTTYGLLVMSHYNRIPHQFKVHNLCRKKNGEVQALELTTTRTAVDLKRQLARFVQAAKCMDTGVFMPCNPGNWKCSPEYCGYWKKCEFGGG
jgi:hypothetical protein